MLTLQHTFEALNDKAKTSFGSFVSHLILFQNKTACESFLQNISFVSGSMQDVQFPSNMVGQAMEIDDGLATVFMFGQFSIDQNIEILQHAEGFARETISATHAPDQGQDQSYHPIWIFNLYEAKKKIESEYEKSKKKIIRKSDAKPEWGVCPNCDHTRGTVGEPCRERSCENKGYHLIPEPMFRRHVQQSKALGRLPDPNLGLLIDRYHLIEKLSESPAGSVYIAYLLPAMRKVVVTITGGCEITQKIGKDFLAEARDVVALYHPAIVQLLDFGVESKLNVPYLVWEHVSEGRSMEEAKKERGLLTWEDDQIKDIAAQLIDGLQLAHENGIVHGNITPDNIMLMPVKKEGEVVKILNFGLLKILSRFPEYEEQINLPLMMASARYAAPEQLETSSEIDPRTDLYSVGAIIFEMLTGIDVCPGATLREVYANKLNREFDLIHRIAVEGVPKEWQYFFRRALAPEKEMRFTSAAAMKKDLLSIGETEWLRDVDFPEVQEGEPDSEKTGVPSIIIEVKPPAPGEEGKTRKSKGLIPVDSRLIRLDGGEAKFVLPLKAQKESRENEEREAEEQTTDESEYEPHAKGKQLVYILILCLLIIFILLASIIVVISVSKKQTTKSIEEKHEPVPPPNG